MTGLESELWHFVCPGVSKVDVFSKMVVDIHHTLEAWCLGKS